MSIKHPLAALAAAALLATPGWALAAGPPSGTPGADHPSATAHPDQTTNPGSTARPSTPGPSASAKAKGKAYGSYCKDQSKKHVKGEKGTAFSRCVTAMAKAATGKASNPTSACKGLSKKHVKGEKGTAFSRCVKAAAQLLDDQSTTTDPGTTLDPGTQATTEQPDPAPAS